MYVLLRLLGIILISAALMLLGADLITSLEKGGTITVRTVEQVWALVNKDGELAFMAWLHRSLPAAAATWMVTVLALPAWSVPGVLGVVLAFLFGRRTPDMD
jgi:hypothetical protein